MIPDYLKNEVKAGGDCEFSPIRILSGGGECRANYGGRPPITYGAAAVELSVKAIGSRNGRDAIEPNRWWDNADTSW